MGRQPSPGTILRWLLAEAAPHKNGDGKYNVEDREDGTTGNAERSELADEFSRLLREFTEQLNRHATEAVLGQEAASVAAATREELRERERMYLGAAMADFEAVSYQGNRNRGSVIDEAEEGDHDEEQDEECDEEREFSLRRRRRSGALKRAHWASVGQNGGAPPSLPSVGGANDPFLAGILEQARVLDAALAEQQQGGSATALFQEMRSIQELRSIGAIDSKIAEELRVIASRISRKQARAVFDFCLYVKLFLSFS